MGCGPWRAYEARGGPFQVLGYGRGPSERLAGLYGVGLWRLLSGLPDGSQRRSPARRVHDCAIQGRGAVIDKESVASRGCRLTTPP
jgi:hypothetical protein